MNCRNRRFLLKTLARATGLSILILWSRATADDNADYPHFFAVKETSLVNPAGHVIRFQGMNLGWPAFFSYLQVPSSDYYQESNPAAVDCIDNQVRFQQEFLPQTAPWGVSRHQSESYFRKFKDQFIQEKDLKRMRQYGVNLVRCSIAWRDFDRTINGLPEPYHYLDKLIAFARPHGIYIQICLFLEKGEDSNSRDLISATGPKGNQFRQAFQNRWVEIATRYAREPVVAVYDLMNEPAWWGGDKDRPANYNQAFYTTIQAIRKVDRNHLIAVEGDHWAKPDGDPALLTKPHLLNNSASGDPAGRLFWSFHVYRDDDPAPGSGNPAVFWQRVRDLQIKSQVPVEVGEIGLHKEQFAWGKANWDLFTANRWSWLYWSWKDVLPGYFAPLYLYPTFYQSALPHSHSFTDYGLDLQLAHLLRHQKATLDALFAADVSKRTGFLTYLNCSLKRFNGYRIDPKTVTNRTDLENALADFQQAHFRACWPWPDAAFDRAMEQLDTAVGQTNSGWTIWNWGDNLEAVLKSRLLQP